MSMFWRYMNYLATWREHREAIKQLNRLTDRELRDMDRKAKNALILIVLCGLKPNEE